MKDFDDFDESELKTFIEEWISNLNLDGEDEVGSAMAETNSIYWEQCFEDAEFEFQEDGTYLFTASVYMPHSEPRNDEAPFSPSDQIDIKIEGTLSYDHMAKSWEVEDYDVSASVNRDDYYDDDYPVYEDRIPTSRFEVSDHLLAKLSTLEGKLWLRGHADESWEIMSSIARQTNPSLSLEKKLRLEFENQTAFLDPSTYPLKTDAAYFQMQHHGLPTRLLDWSISPLIALFFATETNDKDDACIWVLDPSQLNRFHREEFPAKSTTKHFENIEKEKILAIHAPYTNLRMKMQKAEFTLHMDYCAMEDLLEAPTFLREKIIIDSRIKTELRDKLKALGIDRASIYPDLDNIAKVIKDDILE